MLQGPKLAAPAADLALQGVDLFREFIVDRIVIDSGIVGRTDNGNYRRNGGASFPALLFPKVVFPEVVFPKVLAGAEQRRRCVDLRRRSGRRFDGGRGNR